MPSLTTCRLSEGNTWKFFVEILSILSVPAPDASCYARGDLISMLTSVTWSGALTAGRLAAGLAFLMLTSGLALAAGPGRLLLPMTLEGCSKAQGPGDAYPPALAGPCGVFV